MNVALFRVRVHTLPQATLYARNDSPSTLVRRALTSRPTVDGRLGAVWHVGNIRELGSDGVAFALGRSHLRALEVFDKVRGNFIEAPVELAPYTPCLFDAVYQVCGIAAQSRLAPTPAALGRQLEALLNASTVGSEEGVGFRVGQISDPTAFIEYIAGSFAVQRFRATFRPPNAWDAEADFQKPFQNYLAAAGGLDGATTISGPALDPEVLTKVTRAVAATGDDAEATVIEEEGGPRQKKRLQGNFVSLFPEDGEMQENPEGVLERMRDLYRKVRGPE